MTNGIKIKYLDTSVIVKLYLDEDGSLNFRDFFNNHTNFSTTLMTFYESMSVLKSRLFNNKSKGQYYRAVDHLQIHGWGGKIEIEAIDLNSREIFREISEISVEHNLDIADAIQIYAILKGKYSGLCQGSGSVLITADEKQELAATEKGIRVWNCRKTAKPDGWITNRITSLLHSDRCFAATIHLR